MPARKRHMVVAAIVGALIVLAVILGIACSHGGSGASPFKVRAV